MHHVVELCKNPVQVFKDRQLYVDEATKTILSVTPRGICCIPIEGELRGVRSYHKYATSSITSPPTSFTSLSLLVFSLYLLLSSLSPASICCTLIEGKLRVYSYY